MTTWRQISSNHDMVTWYFLIRRVDKDHLNAYLTTSECCDLFKCELKDASCGLKQMASPQLWHWKEYTSCKIHLLLYCHSIKDKLIHCRWSYMCLLLFIVLYFVRNQMSLVAMDTTQLYNQHILWQWTKIENYPSYLDAKQVVPLWHFFAFCLYMWLDAGGSLSFSASYNGTKHVYSSPSAQFIRCILN